MIHSSPGLTLDTVHLASRFFPANTKVVTWALSTRLILQASCYSGTGSLSPIQPVQVVSEIEGVMTSSTPEFVVVLGAGVAGLTTALELRRAFPSAKINVVAKHFPGTANATEYTSPWAGANWMSFEKEVNRFAEYDRASYTRFLDIAAKSPESGVQVLPIRVVYDVDEVRRKKLWFEQLLGGANEVPEHELPPGAVMGLDLSRSFMINTIVYLGW